MFVAPRESGTGMWAQWGATLSSPIAHQVTQLIPSLATCASFSGALGACHSANSTTNTSLSCPGRWGWCGGMDQ